MVMVRPIAGAGVGQNYTPQIAPKTPPKKRPLQISKDLHSLVAQMAEDRNQSLEQIVAFAVIKQAKIAPLPPDGERQVLYRQLIRNAENEIKLRYHSEQSRRSMQMRQINAKRRKNRAAAPQPSASRPQYKPASNQYGYSVEYRYGFAVPKPPPSSYPTYFH